MDWRQLIIGNSILVTAQAVAMRAMAREKYAFHSSFVISSAKSIVQYLSVLSLIPMIGTVDTSTLGKYWLWFLGGGVAFALSHIFTYKLLSYLDAGISGLLSISNIIFAIIFAALILHEDLSARQAVGGLILFLVICYTTLIARDAKHHTGRRAWAWGLAFALLAGFCYGLAIVNEKFLLGRMGVSTYLVFGLGCQMLISTLIAFKGLKKQIKVFRHTNILYLTILSGLVVALSGYMFNLAEIRSDNVALVTLSSNFRLILIVLAGALILKERRKLPQKLLAAVVAMAALSIIFYG
ncbi:MAG TPA: DMT family transporter [Candidatus Saccharimonadales bacterium]|nr:DMT family transporter [Candidatus Saccharimonadales bacterium]